MRKVAIGPIVAILIAALPSAIAATGVDGSYTCSSTSACFSASQSGPSGSSGAGFHGSAVNGVGVRGNSTNVTGVLGQTGSSTLFSPAVDGEVTTSGTSTKYPTTAGGFGIGGINGGIAPVYGVQAYGNAEGVYGQVLGVGTGVLGTDATSGSNSMSTNVGVEGSSVTGTGIMALNDATSKSTIPEFQYGVAFQALNFNTNATSAYFQTGSSSSTIPTSSNGIALEALDFNTNGTGAYFQTGSTGSSSSTIPTFSNGIALVAQDLNSSGQAAYFSEPAGSYGAGTTGGGYVDIIPPAVTDSGYFESQNLIDGFSGSSGFNIDTNGNENLSGGLGAASLYVGPPEAGGETGASVSLVSPDMVIYGSGTGTGSAFYFDNSGDLVVDGFVQASKFVTEKSTQSRTRGISGNERIAYGTRSTAPSLDDVGGGQLVNGSAYVRLDPALADSIDPRVEYRVFVTPQGDSNQLYVTEKSPTGFAVREAHGGRSTIAFDYRIVAKPVDDDGRRLAIAPIKKLMPPPSSQRRHSTWAQTLARHAASLHNPRFAHTHVLGLQALTPQQRFKQMVGPAKYAQALAEFRREQR